MSHLPIDSRVHELVLRGILENCYAPDASELARATGVPESHAKQSLERLSANHALVLQPGTHDVWIAHPFSLSPTGVWVKAAERGWWAPCVWCAFGVAALAGEPVVIHTRIGGEEEAVSIHVDESKVKESDFWVHFTVQPARAWDNVVHFCATVLPFRSAEAVDAWCTRHRLGKGEVVPIARVQELARHWYGNHLSPNWRKWSVSEAKAIFDRVGLTGDFWKLPEGRRRY